MAEDRAVNILSHQAVDPTPKKPIERQYDRYSYLIDDLDRAVNNLGNTIAPVLGPTMPTDTAGAQDTTEQSPMAASLSSVNDRLEELVDIINSFTQRVEL